MKVLKNTRKRKVKREVTSDERKRIRKAAKRRKRKGYDGYEDDDLQDFIASNDEEHDHYDYFDLSDDASVPSPTKSTSSHGSHRRARFEPLTNVILLAGPAASGKTSTVYAIANELQWQVFEVYPGIGKRGYKDLDGYVGMVGENHIMKREAPPVSSFFGKAAASASTSKTAVSMNGTGKLDPLTPASPDKPISLSSATNDTTVKQSCILIEEVDILYEADSGFWEGLISFISKSRRPVILTCNDVNAVPKDSLPLQTILYFQSMESNTARNLLREIARLEGKEIEDRTFEGILGQASKASGNIDIRQAINQLQYLSAVPQPPPLIILNGTTLSTGQPNLQCVQAVLDIASFTDAELRRRSWMSWEVSWEPILSSIYLP